MRGGVFSPELSMVLHIERNFLNVKKVRPREVVQLESDPAGTLILSMFFLKL